jgi:hypothetical protein
MDTLPVQNRQKKKKGKVSADPTATLKKEFSSMLCIPNDDMPPILTNYFMVYILL